MKKLIFILTVTILMTGCCESYYQSSLSFRMYKDDKPLYDQNIRPIFFYKDGGGNEITLRFETTPDDPESWYFINQSEQLEKISFKPTNVFIRYDKLPETDTLEVFLDYSCSNRRQNCNCGPIVQKYIKFNGLLLNDLIIRK